MRICGQVCLTNVQEVSVSQNLLQVCDQQAVRAEQTLALVVSVHRVSGLQRLEGLCGIRASGNRNSPRRRRGA